MIESEREHETVIEVLAAFVRECTGSSTVDDSAWNAEHHHRDGGDSPRLETDVQAARTVIGRRPRRPERNKVDLSLTDLCGADLSGLNFDGVWFWRAKLSRRRSQSLKARTRRTDDRLLESSVCAIGGHAAPG